MRWHEFGNLNWHFALWKTSATNVTCQRQIELPFRCSLQLTVDSRKITIIAVPSILYVLYLSFSCRLKVALLTCRYKHRSCGHGHYPHQFSAAEACKCVSNQSITRFQ